MLSNLAELEPGGWTRLSIQAERDVFDVVIDRVTVYPKENLGGGGQGPHKTEELEEVWR